MSKWAAYNLFRPMRSSTIKEKQLYEEKLKKYSTVIKEINIFDTNKKIKGD